MKYFIAIIGLVLVIEAKYKKDVTLTIPDYYTKFAIKLGDDKAPVKVIQLFAVHCSSCKATHHRYFQKMKEYYIDTNKVQWIFVPYVSDLDTLFWMAAQDCIKESDQFSVLTKILEPNEATFSLRAVLKEAKLSSSNLDYVFTPQNHTKLLEIAKKFQKRVNVDGTPTFYINGNEIEDIPTFEELENHIKEIIE